MKMLEEEKQIPEITVVIPIYDEQENIPELYRRLLDVLNNLCDGEGFGQNGFEIIFVDDGSKDNSWDLIRQLHSKDNRLKGLRFSRNFGHHFAITAGIDYAQGNTVVIMDGDLQDPPEEIEKLYDKYKEGYDIVYGIRSNRQDPLLKKILAMFFWLIINKICSVEMPRNQTMLRILSRRVVKLLNEMKESSRFIHGMIAWVGFETAQVEISHGSRTRGKSKYNLINQIRLALHAVTSFSLFPLRLASYLGFATSIVSFIVGILFIYFKIFYEFAVPGYVSIIVSVFFVGGVQLLVLGMIGEYLGKIYRQSQQRPLYILQEFLS